MYFILVFIFNWIRYMYWNLQWKQEFSKNRSCSPLCGPNHRKLFTTGYLSIMIVGNKVPESGSTGYLFWYFFPTIIRQVTSWTRFLYTLFPTIFIDKKPVEPDSGTLFPTIIRQVTSWTRFWYFVSYNHYRQVTSSEQFSTNYIIENKNNLFILRGHNIYMLRYFFFSRDW
jgi:hypothetical protein